MRILPRYVVLGYFATYAAILFVSLVVIAIIELMVNLDHVLEFGEGVAGVAAYLFLRLPSYYLPLLLPIASFGAAFGCLGVPARSLELLAARASGISAQRLAAPVLTAAAALSVLTLVINETLVIETTRRFEWAKADAESERRLFQARGSFWYQRGPLLVRVESADRDDRSLGGVQVFERSREGRLERSIHADRAWIEDGDHWRLEDAVVREFDPHRPEAVPRTELLSSTSFEVGSAADLALLEADPRSLSLGELGRYIDSRRREGRETSQVRALWHARAADPLSVWLFALLAAPLGVSVERSRSLAAPALRGVALVGGYYALQTVVAMFGSGAATPWLLLAGFGALGSWRWFQMGR